MVQSLAMATPEGSTLSKSLALNGLALLRGSTLATLASFTIFMPFVNSLETQITDPRCHPSAQACESITCGRRLLFAAATILSMKLCMRVRMGPSVCLK